MKILIFLITLFGAVYCANYWQVSQYDGVIVSNHNNSWIDFQHPELYFHLPYVEATLNPVRQWGYHIYNGWYLFNGGNYTINISPNHGLDLCLFGFEYSVVNNIKYGNGFINCNTCQIPCRYMNFHLDGIGEIKNERWIYNMTLYWHY
jgi:hypothetical protein